MIGQENDSPARFVYGLFYLIIFCMTSPIIILVLTSISSVVSIG